MIGRTSDRSGNSQDVGSQVHVFWRSDDSVIYMIHMYWAARVRRCSEDTTHECQVCGTSVTNRHGDTAIHGYRCSSHEINDMLITGRATSLDWGTFVWPVERTIKPDFDDHPLYRLSTLHLTPRFSTYLIVYDQSLVSVWTAVLIWRSPGFVRVIDDACCFRRTSKTTSSIPNIFFMLYTFVVVSFKSLFR